jgi:hypothetical protein
MQSIAADADGFAGAYSEVQELADMFGLRRRVENIPFPLRSPPRGLFANQIAPIGESERLAATGCA